MKEFNREPDFAKKGKLIEISNPQPEIRKNAEKASDWEYAAEAAYLYRMAVLFKDRLLDPVLMTDRGRLPDPVISFENLRNYNTLAAYRLTRNPQGLLYEIIMNTQHYPKVEIDGKKLPCWEFGEWGQLETLLHEMVHLKQQNFGKDPVKPGKVYHNKEFVDLCEAVGLHPKLGPGYHVKQADGPFALLMKELGIDPPDTSQKPEDLSLDWFKWWSEKQGGGRKGNSSLSNWVCPECHLHARIGIKGDPEIIHKPCSEKKGQPVLFVRAEALAQAALGMATTEHKKKLKISPEASEELDKEFERRRDWQAFYQENEHVDYPDPYD